MYKLMKNKHWPYSWIDTLGQLLTDSACDEHAYSGPQTLVAFPSCVLPQGRQVAVVPQELLPPHHSHLEF
jgi:hypothetical protein